MATLQSDADLIPYIHLKLAALGVPVASTGPEASLARTAGPLLRSYRWLGDQLSPADAGFNPFWMRTSPSILLRACLLALSFLIAPAYRVCCHFRPAHNNSYRPT